MLYVVDMKKLTTLLILLLAVVFTNAQTKHALLEEHTGGWCQWCTGGTHYADSLTRTNPLAITVAIHSGDPMAYGAYITSAGFIAAPQANVDRGNQQAAVASWFGLVNTALAATPKSDVFVSTTFNPTTRVLTARVKATFASAASGNYRLGGIIVEDGVHGPSPQYDQLNKYGSGQNGTMGGYETLPQNIPGYMISYNHVARQLLGTYNGQNGSVPASVSAGDTASYVFTHTLPASWNENLIRVIGVLIAPDGSIDNCNKSTYLDGTSNAAPVITSIPGTQGFVNSPYTFDLFASDADDCQLSVTATTLPSWLTLGTASTLGCIHTKAQLSGTPTSTGQFPVVLEVSDGLTPWVAYGGPNGVYVKMYDNGSWSQVGGKITSGVQIGYDLNANDQPYIAVQDFGQNYFGACYSYSGNSWSLVGSAPYSSTSAVWNDLKVNKTTGDVYVFWTDFSGGRTPYVSQWNGTTWSVLGGGSISSDGVWYDQSLDINEATGDVYATYARSVTSGVSAIDAYKFNGTSWTNIGSDVSNGSVEGVTTTMDSAGVLLVSFIDYGSNGAISAMSYTAGSWSFIGPKGFSGGTGSFPVITSYQTKPYVLYRDASVSNMATVKYYGAPVVSVDDFLNQSKAVFPFPNPVNNYFHVSGLSQEVAAKIYSSTGAEVWHGSVNSESKINTSTFANGLYILVIDNVQVKFMVQH